MSQPRGQSSKCLSLGVMQLAFIAMILILALSNFFLTNLVSQNDASLKVNSRQRVKFALDDQSTFNQIGARAGKKGQKMYITAQSIKSLVDPAHAIIIDNPQRLVVSLASGGVALYDLATGEMRHQFEGWMATKVTSLAYSEQINLLFVGYANGSIKVIVPESGEVRRVESGCPVGEPINAIAVSRYGTKVAVGCDRAVSVWTSNPWQMIHQAEHFLHFSEHLAFTGDDQYVRSASFTDVYSLNLDSKTFEPIFTIPGDFSFLKLYPTGDRIITRLDYEGGYQIVNLETGNVAQTLAVGQHPESSILFSEDCTKIVTWGADTPIRVWDINNGEQTLEKNDDSHPLAVFNGRNAFITLDKEEKITISGMKMDHEPEFIGSSSPLIAEIVKLSPDGSKMVVGNVDGTFEVVDPLTGAIELSFTDWAHPANFRVHSMAITEDSGKVVIAGESGLLTVWDLKTGKHLFDMEGATANASYITMMPKKDIVITGAKNGNIYFHDLDANNSQVQYIPRSGTTIATIWKIIPTRDQKRLIVASDDSNVEIWDIGSKKLLKTIATKHIALRSIEVTPDEQTLITAGPSDPTLLWNLTTGDFIRPIANTKRGIHFLELSQDGTTLFLAGQNTPITLLNLRLQTSTHFIGQSTLKTHSFSVSKNSHVAFSSDVGTATLRLHELETDANGECGEMATFWDPLGQRCVGACPEGLYGYSKTRMCVPFCPNGTFGDSEKGRCVDSCPAGLFKDQVTTRCVEQCGDQMYVVRGSDSMCVSKCPMGMVGDIYSRVCSQQCAAEKFVHVEEQTCRKSCPVGMFRDPSTQTCVRGCPESSFQHPYGSRCESECWCGEAAGPFGCEEVCKHEFDIVSYQPTDQEKVYAWLSHKSTALITTRLWKYFAYSFVVAFVYVLLRTFCASKGELSAGRSRKGLIITLVVLPILTVLLTYLYFKIAQIQDRTLFKIIRVIILIYPVSRLISDYRQKRLLVWAYFRSSWEAIRVDDLFGSTSETAKIAADQSRCTSILVSILKKTPESSRASLWSTLRYVLMALSVPVQFLCSWARLDILCDPDVLSEEQGQVRRLVLAEKVSAKMWKFGMFSLFPQIVGIILNNVINFYDKIGLFCVVIIPQFLIFIWIMAPYLSAFLAGKGRFFPHPAGFSTGDFYKYLKYSDEKDFFLVDTLEENSKEGNV